MLRKRLPSQRTDILTGDIRTRKMLVNIEHLQIP